MRTKSTRPIRAILLGAAVLSGVSSAALPNIQEEEEDGRLQPWVTISTDGSSRTVTPTVSSGTTSSTFSGEAALPTAESDGSGQFLVCNGAAGSNGPYRPFCAPMAGEELTAGKTYFVTWDADFFENPSREVLLQGEYSTTDSSVAGDEGFTSGEIPASRGFFAWNVRDDDLPNEEETLVQIYLAYPNGSEIIDRDPGPRVLVKPSGDSGGSSIDPVIIAVPVVLGVLAMAGLTALVWWCGRRRKGWFGGGNGQGYGVRKSKVQRAGTATTDIRLTDDFASSNRGAEPQRMMTGENAFRAEVQRQEFER